MKHLLTFYHVIKTCGVDRYTKNGQLAIAGFSDPHRDATTDDLKLWLPLPDSPPPDLDLETSRFLLSQVGDQFCDLLEQEKEAIQIHMADGNYHINIMSSKDDVGQVLPNLAVDCWVGQLFL